MRPALLALFLALAPSDAPRAQEEAPAPPPTDCWLPSMRPLALAAGAGGALRPAQVDVDLTLDGERVTTRLVLSLTNATGATRHLVLHAPVPAGTDVARLTVAGRDGEVGLEHLSPEAARAVLLNLALEADDAAPVALAGEPAVRSAPIAVAPGERVALELVLEGPLARVGARLEYALPRSQDPEAAGAPWTVRGRVVADGPVSTLYSPSHALEVERHHASQLSFRLAGAGAAAPGPLRLAALLEDGPVTSTAWACPDPRVEGGAGGTFLLLAGLPAEIEAAQRETVRRELLLVLDTSGSMRGEKLDQAREAALQAVEQLLPGESFNLITFGSSVRSLFPAPLVTSEVTRGAAREFLEETTAAGPTPFDTALRLALAQPPVDGHLPFVLLLTDGIPTSGIVDEREIREHAEEDNVHERRILPLGVGFDVNVPLLDALAASARGHATYVDPGEDVEAAVAGVVEGLRGPVLVGPRLVFDTGEGGEELVRHLEPTDLPDLFAGDRVVVLGRFARPGVVRARLGGSFLGEERVFELDLDLAAPRPADVFVPRLWASRTVGRLVDEVRRDGERVGAAPGLLAGGAEARARVSTLLRLSTEYGVLTEYSAFLALEGTDLSDEEANLAKLELSLLDRAQRVRVGAAALSQSRNVRARRTQEVLDRLNRRYDEDLRTVQVEHVRQVHDRTFYRRGETWLDVALVQPGRDREVDELVAFGSPRWLEVAGALAAEGRAGVAALSGNVALEHDGRVLFLERPLP